MAKELFPSKGLTIEERAKIWAKKGVRSKNFNMKKTETQGRRPYMAVPYGTVSLPTGTFITQRIIQKTGTYKGKDQFATFILACSKRHPHKSNPEHYTQNWYVAQVKYYGGYPSVMEFLYKGTEEKAARHRFALIPYNKKYISVPEGVQIPNTTLETQQYTKSNGQVVTTYWAVLHSDGTFQTLAKELTAHREARKSI